MKQKGYHLHIHSKLDIFVVLPLDMMTDME